MKDQTSRFKKFLPLLLALLFLAPWPIAYAYDNDLASTEQVRVTPAENPPRATAWGKAVGSVTPGDLFYLDAGETQSDIRVTLYLTNTSDLTHSYRYLHLKVGVYVKNGSEWGKAREGNGKTVPETYLSLTHPEASFALPGSTQYRVSIDGGSFYCLSAGFGSDSLSPKFYLTVD